MVVSTGKGTDPSIFVNGTPFSVGDAAADASLLEVLRGKCRIKSAKRMCNEGGCGACIVSATRTNAATGDQETFSVNSCLLPVHSAHGWDFTTSEGLGGKKSYHSLQKRLADGHGSQCGFCSPGMVMTMNSLLAEKPEGVTMLEVEQTLDGNICRCTGYRAICDAFKSVASDAPADLKAPFCDIEDAVAVCPLRALKANGESNGTTNGQLKKKDKYFVPKDGASWFYPSTIHELTEVLRSKAGSEFKLICGNTGKGVYKDEQQVETFISTSGVAELSAVSIGERITIGGSVSLSKFIQVMKEASLLKGFKYCTALAEHVEKVANRAVRNTGSIAGNLMIKHQHPEFPSDIFVLLETVGATISIVPVNGQAKSIEVSKLTQEDMKQSIITVIELPKLDDDATVVRTYKVTPRAVNSHAYVNAGFSIAKNEKNIITQFPKIIFGGISPNLVHVNKLEQFLLGKSLEDKDVLREALKILEDELKVAVESDAVQSSSTYRVSLGTSLFYKFLLSIYPGELAEALKSGAEILRRPVSTSKHEYTNTTEEYPVGQPLAKLEGRAQAAGEAQFISDIPPQPGQLYAAIVVSSLGPAKLDFIDATEALAQRGVVRLFTAKDIPGLNSFHSPRYSFVAFEEEQIFADDKILYAGQPVGLIVAESQALAEKAAKLVRIGYKDIQKPVLTPKEAAALPERVKLNEAMGPVEQYSMGNYEESIKSATKTLKGEWNMGGQFHFTLETHSVLCVPTEDGLDAYVATQDMDTNQIAIACAIGIPNNKINMQIRRVGGSFGHKQSRSCMPACAVAVAAHLLGVPVSTHMDLYSMWESMGGRQPYYATYEVGIDDEGCMVAVKADFYADSGCDHNEPTSFQAAFHSYNCYHAGAYKITPYSVRTDTPSTTWMRAPGAECGIAVSEIIMDHIATELNLDPLVVRLRNQRPDGDKSVRGIAWDKENFDRLVGKLRLSSDYDRRRKDVDQFNEINRWRKRGIAFNLMAFTLDVSWCKYNVIVSIYRQDGTVAIAHGGIEVGQGINTKVAQIAARELGVSVDMISVKPTNNLTNPNASPTGGSTTSDTNCWAVAEACKELIQRLQPTREKLGKGATWIELITMAFNTNVDLVARKVFNGSVDIPHMFYVIAGAVTEVELDVLTGDRQVLRVDICEDAGRSISPKIDLCQIEGAFVMGLGMYLTEHIKRHPETGKLLTNGTWEYKPPTALDIPIDFRISLHDNPHNTKGVMRSKAVGEPPLCLSVSAMNALRHALLSARKDAGNPGWFQFDCPATVEEVQMLALNTLDKFDFGSS